VKKKIICKRSDWGWGGGQKIQQNTDRQAGMRMGMGTIAYSGDVVGMGTKYLTHHPLVFASFFIRLVF